jgi:hypothetical protein
MTLKSQITVWSSSTGDVQLGSAQAGAIGASLGNGAASFGQNANNPLQMGDDGNINVQIVSAGRNPASTGADVVVAVFSLPAGALDLVNRGLNIMACGSMNNAATAKTVKLIFNATTAVLGSAVTGGSVIGSFADSTANSNGGFQVAANVFKYGAAGSNTQIAIHESAQANTVLGALQAPTLLTANEAAPILIAVTANAAVAANITFNFLQIFGMN